MLQRATVLCVSLAAWLGGPPAEGADFHCAAGDVACLIQAIRDANGNGEANTIRLEAGIYGLTAVDHGGLGAETGLPTIAGSIAIVGASASDTWIVRGVARRGHPHFRLFEVAETGKLVLEHLTLGGGGGGIEVLGAAVHSLGTLRIRNSNVSGNFAGAGGAIWAPNADVSVSDSHFIQNSDFGGGVIAIGCAGLAVPCSPSTATATFTRNSFFHNSSESVISIRAGAADIRDSDFINNTTLGGAAVYAVGQSRATITNSTVVGNKGDSGARGFAIRGSASADVLVTNSTIINNQGGVEGVRIQNSIVWGNDGQVDSSGDCSNSSSGGSPVTSLGHNLFGDSARCGAVASDLVGDPGFDLAGLFSPSCGIGCEPFLGRPGGRYLRLLPESPAVDAGSTAACPATDQQGLARPIDGTGAGVRGCDIGATEFYPVVNDRLQLEGLKYSFVKPSSLGFVDSNASAGVFRITATFRNTGPDLCHVAFKVPVLNHPTGGTPPVLLTPAGELLGGQYTAVAAAKAGAPPHLVSGASATYQFTIGVQQRASINFLVDALGDATSGQCNQ